MGGVEDHAPGALSTKGPEPKRSHVSGYGAAARRIDTGFMDVKTPTEQDRLWTLRDVARYLGCTPRHVQNMVNAGLPHIKLGRLVRFSPDEIRRYLFQKRALSGRLQA